MPTDPTGPELARPVGANREVASGRIIVIAIVLAALVASAVKIVVWVQNHPTLPIDGRVTEFSLISSDGVPVSDMTLRGHTWVVDFVYTYCAGVCPPMSEAMAAMHREFADKPDVRFVTITIDPKRDTPEQLADYAKLYKADTTRWWFLTGDREVIHNLAVKGLDLTDDVGNPALHSSRFSLIDRDGNVRGTYLGNFPEDVLRLRGDLRWLREERSGFDVTDLPKVNATLNGLAFICILVGIVLIRTRRERAHKIAMLVATGISTVFLVSYVIHKLTVGPKAFPEGPVKPWYLALLGTHTILAACVPVLVFITIRRALRGDFVGHRKIVRITVPVWLYVSLTGVLIYFMLYRWYV